MIQDIFVERPDSLFTGRVAADQTGRVPWKRNLFLTQATRLWKLSGDFHPEARVEILTDEFRFVVNDDGAASGNRIRNQPPHFRQKGAILLFAGDNRAPVGQTDVIAFPYYNIKHRCILLYCQVESPEEMKTLFGLGFQPEQFVLFRLNEP